MSTCPARTVTCPLCHVTTQGRTPLSAVCGLGRVLLPPRPHVTMTPWAPNLCFPRGAGPAHASDAGILRASGPSARRQPFPPPRTQLRAVQSVAFPTGSSKQPHTSRGCRGSPRGFSGRRMGATALWDRRCLAGRARWRTPAFPALSNTPKCARGTIAAPKSRAWLSVRPHKGCRALPGPGPRRSGWAPRGPQHPSAAGTARGRPRAGP